MKTPNYIYHAIILIWLYSGVISLSFQDIGLNLLAQMGFNHYFSLWLLYSASCLDILFAIIIMTNLRQNPLLWLIQLICVIIYNVLMVVLLPKTLLMEQLIHPFAPIIKNIPIMALLFYLYQYHHHLISQG